MALCSVSPAKFNPALYVPRRQFRYNAWGIRKGVITRVAQGSVFFMIAKESTTSPQTSDILITLMTSRKGLRREP